MKGKGPSTGFLRPWCRPEAGLPRAVNQNLKPDFSIRWCVFSIQVPRYTGSASQSACNAVCNATLQLRRPGSSASLGASPAYCRCAHHVQVSKGCVGVPCQLVSAMLTMETVVLKGQGPAVSCETTGPRDFCQTRFHGSVSKSPTRLSLQHSAQKRPIALWAQSPTFP